MDFKIYFETSKRNLDFNIPTKSIKILAMFIVINKKSVAG